MKIFILGKLPPPIGGVTIHTQRLLAWLAIDDSLKVSHIPIKLKSIIYLLFKLKIHNDTSTIVHCQTSSILGVLPIILTKKIFSLKSKVVYSIHSEQWIRSNLESSALQKKVSLFCLNNINRLIVDNIKIKKNFAEYNIKSEVIIPFLPPNEPLGNETISDYLQLEKNIKSSILVFNAYKINYKDGNPDIYGIETLLKAFSIIKIPSTLILLIPQLREDQKKLIEQDISKNNNIIDFFIVSRTDIDGWKVIAKSDLFIRPTITDGDALSIREALFFGVPVITSDCTVRPDGVTLFKTSDHIDLAEKISDFLSVGLIKNHTTVDFYHNPAKDFIRIYKELVQDIKHHE